MLIKYYFYSSKITRKASNSLIKKYFCPLVNLNLLLTLLILFSFKLKFFGKLE